MIKKIVLLSIRFYQLCFARLKMTFPLPMDCPYTPSCSEYFRESVEKFGIGRGGWIGLKRILRCHPFRRGGIDLVPEK